MSAYRFNIVTYRPYAPDGTPSGDMPDVRAALTVRGGWTLSCGLKPDLNSAIISAGEFARINGMFDRPGRIEFWFSAEPPAAGTPSDAQPDVTLEYVSVVGVERGELGQMFNSAAIAPTEYTLIFADFRQSFMEPRGGRLRMGVINSGPMPPTDDPSPGGDESGIPEMPLSEMIQACLDRMGITATLPADVDDTPAPREVKWLGNHAPTELAKLLEWGGLVFCPQLDGTAKLERATADGTPTINGAGQRLPDVDLPIVDRRGEYVVFTSYPTQVLVTEETEGATADDAANYWEFVVQDSTGKWQTLDVCDLLQPKGYKAIIQGYFKDVPEEHRQNVMGQLFRFIRLRSKFWPSGFSPIRSRTLEKDYTEPPVVVNATVAVQDPSTGIWDNTQADIAIQASFLGSDNIVQVPIALATVKSKAGSLWSGFDDSAQFSVRYTVSKSHADDSGRQLPDYFQVGFTRDANGAVQKMPDADVDNALDGKLPNVLILPHPELALLHVDGEDVNRSDLESRMQTLAERYLRNDKGAKQIRVVGFAPIVPSGLITQVQWDQAELLTTANTNDWFTVLGLQKNHLDQGKTAAGDAYPAQGKQESARLASGDVGAKLPQVPIAPIYLPPVLPSRWVSITGVCTCREMYTGVVIDTLTPAPDPNKTTFNFPAGTSKVFVCNMAGNGGANTSPNRPDHVIGSGATLPCWDGPPQPDGTPTVLVWVDVLAARQFRYSTSTHKLQYATGIDGSSGSQLQPLPDSAYNDMVQFVGCSGT